MSTRSKARKSGEYVGGRPWPIVCPVCRSCGGGPPQFFYRARGLCNICYKNLRGSAELDKFPAMPDCIYDTSHQSLVRDPLEWLRREMGGTYAAQFQGADAVREEAQRIFDVAVRRWYGEDAMAQPYHWPTSYEERVWSDELADPGPASSADVAHLKNVERFRRGNENRKRYLLAWRAYGREAHNIVKEALGHARKPKVVWMLHSLTLTWGLGGASISVTALRDDTFIVVEADWEVLREEDFSIETFRELVLWAMRFKQ